MSTSTGLTETDITRTKRNKPVVAINGWGEEQRFSSGREAARQLGIQQSGVTYVLSGKRKTCKGYRFRYAD